MSSVTHVVTAGGGAGEVIAGPATGAGPAGPTVDPAHHTDFHFSHTRRFTMFQALYADLARAHRKRRQREYQRRLEVQAQHEMLLAMPRMLAR
ncbi:hypothetical protein EAH86_12070 [Pedococcus bigeumensis]|uniref:Uncharacterized protein n=1 Tax=Pedococcus bigeumensis TaxID=433644 RepID=A0A502CSX0_9MICO|nr:hypothetical protein EAH86_12070 [Pedococcus bigeumensis]